MVLSLINIMLNIQISKYVQFLLLLLSLYISLPLSLSLPQQQQQQQHTSWVSDKLSLTPTADRGMAFIANELIFKGQLLIREKPILSINTKQVMIITTTITITTSSVTRHYNNDLRGLGSRPPMPSPRPGCIDRIAVFVKQTN